MWNDIDMYHAFRDFTVDPVSFAAEDMKSFIAELVSASKPDWKTLVEIFVDCKPPTLHPNHRRGDSCLEQRDRCGKSA